MENKSRKKGPEKKFGTVTVLLMLLAGLILGVGAQEIRFSNGFTALQMEALVNAMSIADEFGIGEFDHGHYVDSMLKGMAAGLDDDYATYFTKEEYALYNDNKAGTIRGGIGVMVTKEGEDPVMIIEVYEDSPANAAGLKDGDYILKVDGQDVTDKDTAGLSALVGGEVDTQVRITVKRGNNELAFDVVRAVVQSPMVVHRQIDDITYIQYRSFNGNAVEKFTEALESAKLNNSKGIIIDLRDNYGGDLDILTKTADLILPEGEIIYAMNRFGERIVEKKSDAACIDLPIVILTNCNTASASEAFAGAARDHNVAQLVGTTTFGKGIMQTTYPLAGGGWLKLTTAKYYLPSGVCIHGDGITPENYVQLPDGESRPYSMTDEEDTQLQKALELLH